MIRTSSEKRRNSSYNSKTKPEDHHHDSAFLKQTIEKDTAALQATFPSSFLIYCGFKAF
jgi:hypothetical protein